MREVVELGLVSQSLAVLFDRWELLVSLTTSSVQHIAVVDGDLSRFFMHFVNEWTYRYRLVSVFQVVFIVVFSLPQPVVHSEVVFLKRLLIAFEYVHLVLALDGELS